jgi:hypothetical protein
VKLFSNFTGNNFNEIATSHSAIDMAIFAKANGKSFDTFEIEPQIRKFFLQPMPCCRSSCLGGEKKAAFGTG